MAEEKKQLGLVDLKTAGPAFESYGPLMEQMKRAMRPQQAIVLPYPLRSWLTGVTSVDQTQEWPDRPYQEQARALLQGSRMGSVDIVLGSPSRLLTSLEFDVRGRFGPFAPHMPLRLPDEKQTLNDMASRAAALMREHLFEQLSSPGLSMSTLIRPIDMERRAQRLQAPRLTVYGHDLLEKVEALTKYLARRK